MNLKLQIGLLQIQKFVHNVNVLLKKMVVVIIWFVVFVNLNFVGFVMKIGKIMVLKQVVFINVININQMKLIKKNKNKNLEKDKARQAIEKYIHYYKRYSNHAQSQKFEKILRQKADNRMRELQLKKINFLLGLMLNIFKKL